MRQRLTHSCFPVACNNSAVEPHLISLSTYPHALLDSCLPVIQKRHKLLHLRLVQLQSMYKHNSQHRYMCAQLLLAGVPANLIRSYLKVAG